MARKTNCNSDNTVLSSTFNHQIIHQYSEIISLAIRFALHGKKKLDSLMDAIRVLNILKQDLYVSKVL